MRRLTVLSALMAACGTPQSATSVGDASSANDGVTDAASYDARVYADAAQSEGPAVDAGSLHDAPTDDAQVEAGAPGLTLAVDRAASGAAVLVTLTLATGPGAPETPPALTVEGGTASALTNTAGSVDVYTSTVTATQLDTEVAITATWGKLIAKKTALVLSHVDASLGQAVALDGLVNTPGWEDGEDISPDGQWLFVASYTPVDILTCETKGTPTSASCTTLLGPYGAPARPGMLGAERIAAGTYTNTCPDLGITTPSTSAAFFPTAAYGFHRQTDGSFAEPFVIGFDADGCLGPYGFAFTGTPSGTHAAAIFANQDPLASNAVAHLTYTPLTLGQPNILGTYRVVNGAVVETGATTTVLPPVTTTRQGNPFYGGGRFWWDDESLPTTSQPIFFADVTGTPPNVTAGTPGVAAIGTANTQKIQPSFDGHTLYWMGSGTLYSSVLASLTADPSMTTSWSAETALLGPAVGATSGTIAVGEPNVAHVGTLSELYFVYIKTTATGFDCNVARIPIR